MADNGYTKTYQDGQSLTEIKLDTAYKTLKLDISNTTQMTQGATAGHYLKCVLPGSAAVFSALPTASLPTTPVVSKSANYTITDTDGVYTILVTTGTAAITITLPTAADNSGRIINVKKVDSGVGTVIIDGEGGETIDNLTTTTIYSQWESAEVQCNGTAWFSLRPRLSRWISYTPTGGWNTNVTYTGKWRRVGDTMEVDALITCTGAPNAVSCTLDIPSGFTIDTAQILGATSGDKVIGYGSVLDNGTRAWSCQIEYVSTTRVVLAVSTLTAFAGTQYPFFSTVSNTVPFTFGNTDLAMFHFKVPISGWGVNA